MRAGETAVVLIPDETWAAVPKNVAVLRDKTVVEIERETVTRLEIESPKGTVTLAQENGRWKITAPETLPADQVEAGAVVFKLRELRAQAFLTDDASGVPRYLAKPTVRVSISERGGPAHRRRAGPVRPRRAGARGDALEDGRRRAGRRADRQARRRARLGQGEGGAGDLRGRREAARRAAEGARRLQGLIRSAGPALDSAARPAPR